MKRAFDARAIRGLLALLVFFSGGCAAEVPAAEIGRATSELRSVASWEELFDGAWSREDAQYANRSSSADSWQFYNLGYAMDALVSMFEATGKTKYLDRALDYTENMIRTAKVSSSFPQSRFRDSYLGWVSASHPYDRNTDGDEIPLFESYCWRYVARMLRVMHGTPEIMASSAYRSRYDAALAFAEKHMFEKWYQRGTSNLYRSHAHMASHWAYIAFDLARVTTDETRRAQYRQVYENISDKGLPNYGSSIRGQLRVHPVDANAYFWNAVWGSFSRPGQDVSHGNAVVSFLVEAHQHGYHWTADDMRKFVRLLSNVLWPAGGGYPEYVDGSGQGNGWFNDGFCKLGRYDQALQERLENHSVGRGMQLYACGTLNARILTAGAPAAGVGGGSGSPVDAGTADAGAIRDAGSTSDAGTAVDGGSGTPLDGGASSTPDGSSGAGGDAGTPGDVIADCSASGRAPPPASFVGLLLGAIFFLAQRTSRVKKTRDVR